MCSAAEMNPQLLKLQEQVISEYLTLLHICVWIVRLCTSYQVHIIDHSCSCVGVLLYGNWVWSSVISRGSSGAFWLPLFDEYIIFSVL